MLAEGFCECGCGERTPRRGVRFRRGHHMRVAPVKSIAERLWAKVMRGSPGDCWEWQGCKDHKGYGWLQVGTPGKGRTQRVHRVAWEVTHGPIPSGEGHHGICVLHKCDNPACCNPAHLFLGTNADNIADKVAKGRQQRGETHSNARLRDVELQEVRALVRAGWLQRDIADAYGISRSYVSQLKTNTRRSDVLSRA